MMPRPPAAGSILALCLLSLTFCLLFPACSSAPAEGSGDPPSASASSPSDTLPPWESELEEALLAIRGEQYIQNAEYEARIRALLAEIAALREALGEISDGTAAGSPPCPSPSTEEGRPTASDSPADSPANPPADSPEAVFRFELREGEALLLSYEGAEAAVTVPAAIAGYPVVAIGDHAFRGTAVESVVIPHTVTEIGWFAFADCGRLTRITLPASVTAIGYGAFDGSPAVTLHVPRHSYAAAYAESFGLAYEAEG